MNQDSENDENELLAMQIIAKSGDARTKAEKALTYAKQGEFDKADYEMREAETAMTAAHSFHSKLLKQNVDGAEVKGNSVFFAHAQDHVMSTALAIKFNQELIEIYKKLSQMNDKNSKDEKKGGVIR